MSWFSDAVSQGSLNTGAGTPWGAGGQKGAGWNALTTGQGTPWGATGQKGLSSGLLNAFQPNGADIANNGLGGNITDRMDQSLFTGKDTPWGANDQKSMRAARDPLMTWASNLASGPDQKGGVNDWEQTTNQGQLQAIGMGDPAIGMPDKPTLQTDYSQYKAPDYADYNRSGQEAINHKLAQDRLGAAAGLQKGGALASGDTGLAFSNIDQSGQAQRGGLANAISNMQTNNQWQQLNAANDATNSKYSNDWDKYQANRDSRNANRQQIMNNTGTFIGLAKGL